MFVDGIQMEVFGKRFECAARNCNDDVTLGCQTLWGSGRS